MLDLSHLMFQLLRRPLPYTITIRDEVDVDTIDELPTITYRLIPGPSIDGGTGKPPSAWACELGLDIFAPNFKDATKLAGEVYDLLHTWNDVWGEAHIIPELGHASKVEDRGLFSKVYDGPLDSETSITQLSGLFGLQLHQA
jgi:hypothetical protein